jgi:hypothetical protein
LEKYQFVQYPGGRYVLQVQLDSALGDAVLENLRAGLQRDLVPVLGPGASFEVTRTEKLGAREAGKFRYVLNYDLRTS